MGPLERDQDNKGNETQEISSLPSRRCIALWANDRAMPLGMPVDIMRKLLPLAALPVVLSATSVFAASTYYVSQKAGGGACSVTTKKPDGTKVMMIGTA